VKDGDDSDGYITYKRHTQRDYRAGLAAEGKCYDCKGPLDTKGTRCSGCQKTARDVSRANYLKKKLRGARGGAAA
jgi:hypothetical protein